MNSKHLKIFTVLLTAFCCSTQLAYGFLTSVKSFGMAGTGVAYPQDSLAAAFNPAGHMDISDRLDLGVNYAHYKGHATLQGNLFPPVNGRYAGYRAKDFYTPDFGINKRFGEEGEWAFGFLLYNRNFSKTTYKVPFALLGTSRLGLEYMHETFSPVLAYRINANHQVGITLNCMVQRLKVNGLQNFDNVFRSAYPGHVTNRGYSYSYGFGVTLGWQWHIHPDITIGATYQPETSMSHFKKYKGFLADKGKFNIPSVYSGGIAWRFLPSALIAFDIQHYSWHQIKALHNPLLNGTAVALLGSKNGPGFGWKSQTFYRVGLEYALTDDLMVRLGYRHVNIPFNKTQTVVNLLTLESVNDFITFGTTYKLGAFSELSGFFAYGFEKTIKGGNSIPPGNPRLGGFGGGEANLHQQIIVAGVSYGWEY